MKPVAARQAPAATPSPGTATPSASSTSALPQPCEVGRYHSLIAAPESLPPALVVSARTDEGEIMGVRHRTLAVEGVQFHPESILTPHGPRLLENFLEYSADRGGAADAGAA